ncbi:MAG: hypothetical protein KIT83_12430 [Bryobacterales bacterium]|nr:hypothetical protein [Bryobacterales bacterium]
MARALLSLGLLTLSATLALTAQNAPMLRSLDKPEALRGDKVTVTGQNLAKPNVAGLYLTKGTDDVEVTVEEQTDTSIRFVVGKSMPFGRYGLLVLTGGEAPMYIEQPVKLNVVEKLTPQPQPEEAPAEPPAEGAKPPGA